MSRRGATKTPPGRPLFAEVERQERLDRHSAYRPPEPPNLSGVQEVFLDVESTGLEWWAGARPVGLAVATADASWYLPTGHLGGNLSEEGVKTWCRDQLWGKRIVNLNTKFDIHQMREWGVDFAEMGCTVADVAHYAALLDDHRRRFNLNQLALDFLGRGKKDLDPKAMATYHAAEVEDYARNDVELVRDLQAAFWPMMDREELHEVRRLEEDVIFPVCEMERNATRLDEELLDAWCRESLQDLERLLWEVHRLSGVMLRTPDSSDDLLRLFVSQRVPVTKMTDTGGPSFDASVMKEGARHSEAIAKAFEAAKLADLRSKYLLPYRQHLSGGRLRFHLHQLRTDDKGTVSGRFSATEQNIQQVMAVEKNIEKYGPKYVIRRLFIPPPGRRWIAADAAQIEYRLFAHYANDPRILEAYARDPRLSYHKLVWDMIKPFKPDILYRPVKNLNFAKIYGAGKDKVAEMLGLARAESDRFVRIYDRQFPTAGALLRKASEVAQRRGYVKTIKGRRVRFPVINGERQRLHKALNGVIQGGAADINKIKLKEAYDARKELDLNMGFTVHDELDGDVPDDSAQERLQEIMDRQTTELKVPILWELGCGKDWADAKGDH